MAKGKLKKKIQKGINKLGNKLQQDAKDIASIEIPTEEVVAAPEPAPVVEKKEPQPSTDTWKIRVSDI